MALGEAHASGNGKPSCDLRISSRQTSVATLTGDHDLASQPMVMDALAQAIERPNVIIDLTRCTLIDTTTLEAFYAARRAQRPRDRIELVIAHVDDCVNRWSHLTGVRMAILTHKTLAEALSSMGEAGT